MKHRPSLACVYAAALLALFAVVGCSGPTEDSHIDPKPGRGGGAGEPGDRAGGSVPSGPLGSVSGRVTFSGTVPPARTIRMTADPFCAGQHEGGAKQSPVRAGTDGGLAEVVVHVKSGLGGSPFAVLETPVVLDQRHCLYSPRVLAVQAGQPLEIRNSDNTLHNVHAVPERARGFNIGMPGAGRSAVRKFNEPEVFVRIKCDVHPWMAAHVAVVDHPYFAVTGDDGRFELEGLPTGEYTVEAVHPSLGASSETVTVSGDADSEIAFAFSR